MSLCIDVRQLAVATEQLCVALAMEILVSLNLASNAVLYDDCQALRLSDVGELGGRGAPKDEGNAAPLAETDAQGGDQDGLALGALRPEPASERSDVALHRLRQC